MCNTVVRQTVNANSYPDAARRSDSTATASSLPSRQGSTNFGNSIQQGLALASAAAPSYSPRQGHLLDTDASANGVRGFSPPPSAAGGTSRTAQLFALAEQYDLQGLEAAFEGMQAPHRTPPPAQQATSPAASAALAQSGTRDTSAAETGGVQVWQTSQKLSEPSGSTLAQTDALPVTTSAAVMGRQPTQVSVD